MKISNIKSIDILGNKIRIKQTRSALMDGVHGRWNYDKKTIEMAPIGNDNGNVVMTEDIYAQTLIHEITHAILDYMGMYKKSRDEGFVEAFSNAIFLVNKQLYRGRK